MSYGTAPLDWWAGTRANKAFNNVANHGPASLGTVAAVRQSEGNRRTRQGKRIEDGWAGERSNKTCKQ